jgi:hypothetical protein
MNVLKRQHREKGKVWFLIEISIQKQNASTFLLCIGKNISGQNRFKDEIGFYISKNSFLAFGSKDFFSLIFPPHPPITGVNEQIQTKLCSMEDERVKEIQKNQSFPLNSLLKLQNTAIHHNSLQ